MLRNANSVFIEIVKSYVNTKFNIICGCVYIPPFMALKQFNERLANMLGVLQPGKVCIVLDIFM